MARIKFFFPLILTFSLVACAARKTDFSSNFYFDGLNAMNKGKSSQALLSLRASMEKDSKLPALLAKEELLRLLHDQGLYNEIISLTEAQVQTDSAHMQTENDFILESENKNLVQRRRLTSMIHTAHPQAEKELLQWLFFTPFSMEHLNFFEDTSLAFFFSGLRDDVQKHILFKAAVYKRNYVRALALLKEQAKTHKESTGETKSDIALFLDLCGKTEAAVPEICAAVFYGSKNNQERATYAEQLIKAAIAYSDQQQKAFYCNLYASRLYARLAEKDRAFEQFKKTIETAADKELFDKALWYYLNTALKNSSRSAITVLQKYAPLWNNAAYFDDLLELLSHNVLAARNWNGYYRIYKTLSPYMSADSASKYAFIAGRLAETGLLAVPAADCKKAYETAYENNEGSLYYRLLAAERLDIASADIERSLLRRKKKHNLPVCIQAESLLIRYGEQGFENKIYPLFFRFKDRIGAQTTEQLNSVLSKKGLYSQALRTAVWAFGQSDIPVQKTHLKMLYPRFYSDMVNPVCAHYEIPEYLIYALIRSESFFDKNIRSNAGAIGLTQLMSGTAADIARKLKRHTYNLSDAFTNTEFGAFYLKELLTRLNGSVLLALFSYNAGITKVRRWNAEYPELSKDLLLEVLPYKETRHYGQKILTAAALYACLYYGKTTHEIIREIMQ